MSRPSVTLKLATSLDGRIATGSGESKWITGEAARAAGHRLRAEHDAILVGVGTVLADDPALTVRLSGGSEATLPFPSRGKGSVRQPLRIILDSRLRTPAAAQVASGNTLIFTAAEPRPIGQAEVLQLPGPRPEPAALLDHLAGRGIRSVLVEGGGQVAASFISAGLIDRLEWFRAPSLLGAEGRPCVAALALAKLSQAPKFRRLSAEPVGDDLWECYEAIR